MRCIIGLGNPGNKYELSRHNIGFIILDSFASKHKLRFNPSKKDYYYSEGIILSSDFFLIKPTTYMNMSGVAALDVIEEHNISVDDLLVIVDDTNLEFGKIRLRSSGSDGGHNGLKSIIYYLQNENFARLRFGVDNKFANHKQAEYVLSKFSKKELSSINENIELSLNLVEQFIIGGYKAMSNLYSQTIKKLKENDDEQVI